MTKPYKSQEELQSKEYAFTATEEFQESIKEAQQSVNNHSEGVRGQLSEYYSLQLD